MSMEALGQIVASIFYSLASCYSVIKTAKINAFTAFLVWVASMGICLLMVVYVKGRSRLWACQDRRPEIIQFAPMNSVGQTELESENVSTSTVAMDEYESHCHIRLLSLEPIETSSSFGSYNRPLGRLSRGLSPSVSSEVPPLELSQVQTTFEG